MGGEIKIRAEGFSVGPEHQEGSDGRGASFSSPCKF